MLAAAGVFLSAVSSASAQAVASNLPSNETIAQALRNYASGSYTPGEAKIAAQVLYWEQKEAGASDEVATQAALEVPPSAYEGTSGGLSDLWDGISSLDAEGSEAYDSAGELLDAATSALGDTSVDTAIGEACVDTALFGCLATAAAVGVGAAAYLLFNGAPTVTTWDHGKCAVGGNNGSGPYSSCTPQSSNWEADVYDYTTEPPVRHWVPSTCFTPGSPDTGKTWTFNADGQGVSAYLPCGGLPGVFYLTWTGESLAGSSANTVSNTTLLYGGSDTWPGTWPGSNCSIPGNNYFLLSEDPGLPPNLSVGSTGLASGGASQTPGDLPSSGWLFDETGQVSGCTGTWGSQSWAAGEFIQSPGAVPISFPQPQGCSGISGGCEATATGNPPAATVGQLASILGDSAHGDANQLLTSVAGGTSNGQPVVPPGALVMPSCAGGSVSACEAALQSAGITGTVTSTAADCAGSQSGVAAGDVIGQTPSAGVEVDSGAGLAVVTNPLPACIALPEPSPLETGTAYVTELENDGFTDVELDTYSDTNEDSSLGPNQVVDVRDDNSGEDYSFDDKIEPEEGLEVWQNPSDAPEPVTGSGGAGSDGSAPAAPTPPGLSIPTAPTPCSVFPFGIPCWISNQLGQFSGSAVAPSISLPMPGLLGGGTWNLDLGGTVLGVDPSSVMDVIRPVLLIASFIGLVLWLGGMAMGGSTGAGGSTEDTE